jgi:hypothetical protein
MSKRRELVMTEHGLDAIGTFQLEPRTSSRCHGHVRPRVEGMIYSTCSTPYVIEARPQEGYGREKWYSAQRKAGNAGHHEPCTSVGVPTADPGENADMVSDDNLRITGESEIVAHDPEQGQNPIGLNLNLTGAQSSSSSLLEAVIGPEHAKQPLTTQRSTGSPLRPAIQATSPQLESDSLSSSRGGSSVSKGSSMERIEKSDKSSSEWEVLSDAASRVNSGQKPDAVEVEELQKKVDKR